MNAGMMRFRRSVTKICGLRLEDDERAILIRLARPMRAFNVANLEELCEAIERGTDKTLLHGVIDALVTTQTQFFGDRAVFERFGRETLPRLNLKARPTRIWCAGCATGQEAYSLAMLIKETPYLADAEIEILATDISRAALEAAQLGLYSQFEVQRGLSTARLLQHFEMQENAWRTKHDLRSRIVFNEFNLLDDFSSLGRFDVIFCQNVLDYFEENAKRDVLAQLSQALVRDGSLFLGGLRHNSTLLRAMDGFYLANKEPTFPAAIAGNRIDKMRKSCSERPQRLAPIPSADDLRLKPGRRSPDRSNFVPLPFPKVRNAKTGDLRSVRIKDDKRVKINDLKSLGAAHLHLEKMPNLLDQAGFVG